MCQLEFLLDTIILHFIFIYYVLFQSLLLKYRYCVVIDDKNIDILSTYEVKEKCHRLGNGK